MSEFWGQSQVPEWGQSQVPEWGQSQVPEWGQMAVRQGDWKLVSYASKIDEGEFLRSDSREQTTPHRLYNLEMDIAETKDLASSELQKVTELLSLWNIWNAEMR